MEKEITRCNRCILPENFPNIKFDEDGICNYCKEWDRRWKDFDYVASERRLLRIFKWAKSKKRIYDCLIPFSGGRDSSYVLYLLKRKYSLNPLVVTFNNLFMSDYALENIFRIVEFFNVDHVYVTYSPSILKDFYRTMILNTGEFCSICSAGINYVKYTYQRKFKIPIVITGTSGRVDEQSPFEVNCTHPLYVRRVLKMAGFSQSEIEKFVVPRHYEWGIWHKIRRKIFDYDYIELALPDFVHWKNYEIQKTLEKKLGWRTPDRNRDHIDCKYASIKEYLKNKQIPHFIFKQEKFSQLIRDGQMTRQEALRYLHDMISKEHKKPPEYFDFLNFFNLKPRAIEELGNRSHLDFIKKYEIIPKESVAYKVMAFPWKIFKHFTSKVV